jgi:hypothetical protein
MSKTIAPTHNELIECEVLLEEKPRFSSSWDMGKKKLRLLFCAITSVPIIPIGDLQDDSPWPLTNRLHLRSNQAEIVTRNPVLEETTGATQHGFIFSKSDPLKRLNPDQETVVRDLPVNVSLRLIPTILRVRAYRFTMM